MLGGWGGDGKCGIALGTEKRLKLNYMLTPEINDLILI